MDSLIPIENSSNLTGYYYEPATQCLFIEFRGGAIYSYDWVPTEVVVQFEDAPSKGAFLAKHIRNKYKCTKFKDADSVKEKDKNNENNAGK